jgi:hypothetical protein
VLSQVTAACPVFIASRWSYAPPPRFDLIRAIREPRVPDSAPGGVEGDALTCPRLDIQPRRTRTTEPCYRSDLPSELVDLAQA